MSNYTHARAHNQHKSPTTSDDEKRRLALTSPTRGQHSPTASEATSPTAEHVSPTKVALNDPGHSFAEVAVQPAPETAHAPQMKLRVSRPSDPHEQEADQVADAVMGLSDIATTALSHAPSSHETSTPATRSLATAP